MRSISSQQTGLLDVTADVLNALKQKHPEPAEAELGAKMQGPQPEKNSRGGDLRGH